MWRHTFVLLFALQATAKCPEANAFNELTWTASGDKVCSPVSNYIHKCKTHGYTGTYDSSLTEACCARDVTCDTLTLDGDDASTRCKTVNDKITTGHYDYVIVTTKTDTDTQKEQWTSLNSDCGDDAQEILQGSTAYFARLEVDTEKKTWLYVAAGGLGGGVLLVLLNKFL